MNQSSIKNGLIYAVIRHDAINCITAISLSTVDQLMGTVVLVMYLTMYFL